MRGVSRPPATASTTLVPEDGKRITVKVAVDSAKLRCNTKSIQRTVLLFACFPLDFMQQQCQLLSLVYLHFSPLFQETGFEKTTACPHLSVSIQPHSPRRRSSACQVCRAHTFHSSFGSAVQGRTTRVSLKNGCGAPEAYEAENTTDGRNSTSLYRQSYRPRLG